MQHAGVANLEDAAVREVLRRMLVDEGGERGMRWALLTSLDRAGMLVLIQDADVREAYRGLGQDWAEDGSACLEAAASCFGYSVAVLEDKIGVLDELFRQNLPVGVLRKACEAVAGGAPLEWAVAFASR